MPRDVVEPATTALSWQNRLDNYKRETRLPQSMFVAEDGRVAGTWIMGNSYKVRSGLYGGYPDGFLKRLGALFPDRRRVLHLFSGMVDLAKMPGDTVDIDAAMNPTWMDDAQTLEHVPVEDYDLIVADPPYSASDAERYGTTIVKRNRVVKALAPRMMVGARLAWLDQTLPMYASRYFELEAVIGIVKSTNHRFRVLTIFRCCRGER
jgi:hypothetical protein